MSSVVYDADNDGDPDGMEDDKDSVSASVTLPQSSLNGTSPITIVAPAGTGVAGTVTSTPAHVPDSQMQACNSGYPHALTVPDAKHHKSRAT